MKETEFKFEPVWVSVLGLLGLYIAYLFCKDIIPDLKLDSISVVGIVGASSLLLLLLPMSLKMIFGIPAIRLTSDQLIDNVVGIKIEWKDISDIRISGIAKPFIAITLKDKSSFFQSISNPVKRLLLRCFFLISSGDVSINLAMVAGDNESIVALTKVYWNRYYGIND